MSTTELLKPILEGGIQHTYFFNGRFLSGDDLENQKAALHQHLIQAGRVAGEGVVSGLEVAVTDDGSSNTGQPTLSISKGLAVNRAGQILELPGNISLKLVPNQPGTTPQSTTGQFTNCDGAIDNGLVPTGTGVYILTAAPAQGYKGKAPMHRLEDDGTISTCNHRYVIEGLQFRLIFMDVTNPVVAEGEIGNAIRFLLMQPESESRLKLRNLLAHLCLGTEPASSFYDDLLAEPFSSAAPTGYGPLDLLRNKLCLKESDVPLALVVWTKKGLSFTDMWSVRRNLHSSFMQQNTLFPMSSRRSAELNAGSMQFQDQLTDIIKNTAGGSVMKATDHFRFLPAAGIVPLPASESGDTVNDISFFQGLTYRAPVFMEGIKLRGLLAESLSYDPIDLEIKRDSASKELIWLYRVRQNYEATNKKKYSVFCSGYIPFRGEAQYDLSRWDYSNYGPGVAAGSI